MSTEIPPVVFTSTSTCMQVVMQLLQRLLEHEKGSLEGKWGDLVSEVIAAIDGEKDPRCLLLSFRIVELLVQVRHR